MKWVTIANKPGHGFEVIGIFNTRKECEAWLAKHKVNGIARHLVAPEEWEKRGT